MKKVIGLTGGIGSGKSTAARILKQFGAHIIDCDAISHEVTAPGGVAIEELAAAFEGVVKNGVLDRAALSKIVFNNEQKRNLLNAVTHKYIMKEVDRRLSEADGLVVIDAPLLFEAEAHTRCDAVVFIDAPVGMRLLRVMARDGLTQDEAMLRINAQNTDENKRRADIVIDNSAGEDELKKQILEEIGANGI